MWETLMMLSMFLAAVILILLVLVQRGKGGGLAGALGGMGGQSAFGTKAGDTFTKITVGVATAWIVLCMIAVSTLGPGESKMNLNDSGLNSATTTSNDAGAGAGEAAPEGQSE